MKRVLSVFGTRPEAIKMAPVVHALQASDLLESRLCVTGQHRDMLDDVLTLFGLVPDCDLDVMKPNQGLAELTSRVLLGMRAVLSDEQPDLVLVHGDTTTCFAATLAAFYAGIPVGHVEAGLRTGNLAAPFPEEANRLLADRLCTLHFAPTEGARRNLLHEGQPETGISVTGNTVIDALLWMRERVCDAPLETWQAELGSVLELLQDASHRLVLITGHRRENFGGGFQRICEAIVGLSSRYPSVQFVYPVHLNPNVQGPVYETLGSADNVHLIRPLSYAPFVRLLDASHLVLTDSGGIQEEAPSLGKPVLVMRDVTERPEAVEAGTVVLVGTDVERIQSSVGRLLEDSEHYETMSRAHNPYGDGQAAGRIVASCEQLLG